MGGPWENSRRIWKTHCSTSPQKPTPLQIFSWLVETLPVNIIIDVFKIIPIVLLQIKKKMKKKKK